MSWQANAVGVVGLVGLVVGCASGSGLGTYHKPGVSEADTSRDRSACLRSSASDSEPFRLSGPTIDREAFARCMESRGYTRSK